MVSILQGAAAYSDIIYLFCDDENDCGKHLLSQEYGGFQPIKVALQQQKNQFNII